MVLFAFIYRLNDQTPAGCLHCIFLSTPSLAPSFGKSATCISSSYHFKLSQALLQVFTNRTARISSRTVVTVQRRQSSLLLGTYAQTHSLIHLVGPPKSPSEGLSYSYSELIHHAGFWHLAHMFNSCNVILLLCIAYNRSIDTVRFALLATYASSLHISPHFSESRIGIKNLSG